MREPEYEFTIRKGRYGRWAVIIPVINTPAAIIPNGHAGGRWGTKQQAQDMARRLNNKEQ